LTQVWSLAALWLGLALLATLLAIWHLGTRPALCALRGNGREVTEEPRPRRPLSAASGTGERPSYDLRLSIGT
jgi:hypothetical protein